MTIDKFCKHCGSTHTMDAYPLSCDHCQMVTYNNPIPVAIMIQPFCDRSTGRVGVLLGRRDIEPRRGEWTLVGGHMEHSDASFEQAAIRECFEETGIRPSDDFVKLTSSFTNGKGHVLVFVTSGEFMEPSRLNDFVPNRECSEIKIAWRPEPLAFPSHTDALRAWFIDYEQNR